MSELAAPVRSNVELTGYDSLGTRETIGPRLIKRLKGAQQPLRHGKVGVRIHKDPPSTPYGLGWPQAALIAMVSADPIERSCASLKLPAIHTQMRWVAGAQLRDYFVDLIANAKLIV